jgi:hypothetical protein
MFSLRILFWSVVRFRPSLSAAPPLPETWPDPAFSASTITLRSACSNAEAVAKTRVEAIITACTREPDPTGIRGAIYATTDKMDMWDSWKWLEEIVSLYAEAIKREEREKIARGRYGRPPSYTPRAGKFAAIPHR